MKPKIINKFTLAERLDEAVDAMRNINHMPAAEWQRRFPTFYAAAHDTTFQSAGHDQWKKQIDAMNTELALRTAEFLLAWRAN
jgi:hypothetical protein